MQKEAAKVTFYFENITYLYAPRLTQAIPRLYRVRINPGKYSKAFL